VVREERGKLRPVFGGEAAFGDDGMEPVIASANRTAEVIKNYIVISDPRLGQPVDALGTSFWRRGRRAGSMTVASRPALREAGSFGVITNQSLNSCGASSLVFSSTAGHLRGAKRRSLDDAGMPVLTGVSTAPPKYPATALARLADICPD